VTALDAYVVTDLLLAACGVGLIVLGAVVIVRSRGGRAVTLWRRSIDRPLLTGVGAISTGLSVVAGVAHQAEVVPDTAGVPLGTVSFVLLLAGVALQCVTVFLPGRVTP
jgi:hypothetical protein